MMNLMYDKGSLDITAVPVSQLGSELSQYSNLEDGSLLEEASTP
jgi:hypothetical protein